MKLDEMIKAQQSYADAYNLKSFSPKGDLGLINWIYKHQGEKFLPLISETRYIFVRDEKHIGRSALAIRLVIGIAIPFSVATAASKRHIDRVANALSEVSSHPEVSAWDETMSHYGFPTSIEELADKDIVFEKTIYGKHVGNGIPSPKLSSDSWMKLTKNFLQQHEDLPKGFIFGEDYPSEDHWETNWKLLVNNSFSSY